MREGIPLSFQRPMMLPMFTFLMIMLFLWSVKNDAFPVKYKQRFKEHRHRRSPVLAVLTSQRDKEIYSQQFSVQEHHGYHDVSQKTFHSHRISRGRIFTDLNADEHGEMLKVSPTLFSGHRVTFSLENSAALTDRGETPRVFKRNVDIDSPASTHMESADVHKKELTARNRDLGQHWDGASRLNRKILSVSQTASPSASDFDWLTFAENIVETSTLTSGRDLLHVTRHGNLLEADTSSASMGVLDRTDGNINETNTLMRTSDLVENAHEDIRAETSTLNASLNSLKNTNESINTETNTLSSPIHWVSKFSHDNGGESSTMSSTIDLLSNTSGNITTTIKASAAMKRSEQENQTLCSTRKTINDTLLGSNDSECDTLLVTPKNSPIWEQGSVTPAEFSSSMFTLRASCVPILILSVTAGVINVFIVSQQRMVHSTKIIIVSFNVAETVKSVCFLTHRLIRLIIPPITSWDSLYTQFFVNVVLWFPDAMGRIGIVLNLISILDRFVSMTYPLRSRGRSVLVFPKTTVLSVYFAVIAYSSSGLIMYYLYVRPLIRDSTGIFKIENIISEMRKTTPKKYEMFALVYAVGEVLFRYIPVLLTDVLNGLTTVAFIRHRKGMGRVRQSGPSSHATQINTIIIGTSVCFSILVSFRGGLRILDFTSPIYGVGKREYYLYALAHEVALVLDTVIPLANFCFYLGLHRSFRKLFISMWHCRRPSFI